MSQQINHQTTLTDRELPGKWKLSHTGTVTKQEGIKKMTYASETYLSENHKGEKMVASIYGNGQLTICANQKSLLESISYSMAGARKRLIGWIENPDDIPVATMREEDKQIAERE